MTQMQADKLYQAEVKTKQDLTDVLNTLLEPLTQYYTESKATLTLSQTGVGYGVERAGMESFLHQLWGIASLLSGGQETAHMESIIQGMINGTDPEHKDYWGDIEDFDQRIVEIAAIGYSLILAPDKFWTKFSEEEKQQIGDYLRQVNNVEAFDCNWLFFAVMVNVGLKTVGETYSQEVIDTNLDRIDTFYLKDGWYKDGARAHIDYYVSFAIHFYSLIYASAMEKEDPERCQTYKERAKLFIRHFTHWFSEEGQAIPYGRSMTYRFSQVAFFTAYIYADVDESAVGWIKGVIFRHLRYWFKQPILNGDGTLSVGYAYPNLMMSENYNSPGSPYWSLKAFLPLALPDDHMFWQTEEASFPDLESTYTDAISMQTICRKDGHVVMFPSGYDHTNAHNHVQAKYEKFVYSTHFGFSVPRSDYSLDHGAYDSMLAISHTDALYQVKTKVIEKEYTTDYNYMKWEVFPKTVIETWIIPGLPSHVRVHKIKTDYPITFADHGFSLRKENQLKNTGLGKDALLIKDGELSGVVGAKKFTSLGDIGIVHPHSNTNLLHPNTAIPVIKGKLEPGTHLLVHGFYGDINGDMQTSLFEKIEVKNGRVTIGDKEIKLDCLKEIGE